MRSKRAALFLLLVCVAVFAAGCDDPNKNYQKGEYQKAYDGYMKNAQNREAALAREWDTNSLPSARDTAAKLVEDYYKAGECKEKLGDPAAARALFEKATKTDYTVTERYTVMQEVWVDAGYQQVWVPGGYQEVWIDGRYEEIWVDPYYDAQGVYHDGYYRKVWRDGYYQQRYVDGRYETKWVAGHYEQKAIYKTKPYSFTISSAYADQARAKLGTTATRTQEPAATEPAAEPTVMTGADAAAIKAAKEALDTAYRRWVASGSKTSGTEYLIYQNAKAEYEKMIKQ